MAPLLLTHDTLITGKARDLVERLADGSKDVCGFGFFVTTVYDTAWLSMVFKVVNGEKKPLCPQCFSYLLREQQPSGGWAVYARPVDGILNSLAALLSYVTYVNMGFSDIVATEELNSRIAQATAAISSMLRDWVVSSTIHVGFEILVPSLLRQLAKYGITFDFPGNKMLMDLEAKKLAKFSPGLLYGKEKTTLLHSLEAFVDIIDFDKIAHHLTNGSMLGSPASTAAYLMHATHWDPSAEAYLELACNNAHGVGGVPSAYPTSIFEISWSLSTLLMNGFDIDDLKEYGGETLCDYLMNTLKSQHGTVGFAPSILADADDTAMSIFALNQSMRHHDCSAMITQFFLQSHFRTYAHETSPSFSANCNVLKALLTSNKVMGYEKEIEKSLQFVLLAWEDGPISDKWNLSPLYSMMLMINSLSEVLFQWDRGNLKSLPKELIELKVPIVLFQAFCQIIHGQDIDGSWGQGVETTAYAIIGLTHCLRFPWPKIAQGRVRQCIMLGREYLSNRVESWSCPSFLWVEKVSYGSPILSEAYCIAAMRNPLQQNCSSDQLNTLLDVPATYTAELCKLVHAVPLFRTKSAVLAEMSPIESYYYLKQLERLDYSMFPAQKNASNKYLRIIPFTWVGCNIINNFVFSGRLLWDMMVLSVLIYQADEYMEAFICEFDSENLLRLQSFILDQCGCTIEQMQHLSSSDLVSISRLREDTSSSSRSNGTEHEHFRHGCNTLRSFIGHIARHPLILKSSLRAQQSVAMELCSFLQAHIQHIKDNEKLRSQPSSSLFNPSSRTTLIEFEKNRQSYFDWVRTIASDDTSCPFAFAFLLGAICTPEIDCISSVQAQYFSQALCRHLSTMCRQYNDLGSLTRDQEEKNLNGLNFPEFHHGTGSSPTTNKNNEMVYMNTHATHAKNSMMQLAEYERMCVEMTMGRLRHEVEPRVSDAIMAFVNVTDLYGQIYVIKDFTNRTQNEGLPQSARDAI